MFASVYLLVVLGIGLLISTLILQSATGNVPVLLFYAYLYPDVGNLYPC